MLRSDAVQRCLQPWQDIRGMGNRLSPWLRQWRPIDHTGSR